MPKTKPAPSRGPYHGTSPKLTPASPSSRSLSTSQSKPREVPLWRGPVVDGITQSLLGKFLTCRHRFWLKVVCGLDEPDGFDHKMEYGNLWHEAEAWHSAGKPWDAGVNRYTDRLLKRYPESADQIKKWQAICKHQFALYLKYWLNPGKNYTNLNKDGSVAARIRDGQPGVPICQERNFAIPYKLPSGRIVLLRGKFDRVYREKHEIWLQENKCKGEIDEQGIQASVCFNLQTMMYQIALHAALCPTLTMGLDITKECPKVKNSSHQAHLHIDRTSTERIELPNSKKPYHIAGVLYNVIRRPLADRFAIKKREGRTVRKKNGHGNTITSKVGVETDAQFYQRVADTIKADPNHYFMRWQICTSKADIDKFRRESFDPILEQLCDWWEWIAVDPFDPWRPRKASEFVGPEPIGSTNNQRQIARAVVAELDKEYIPSPHFLYPFGVFNSLWTGWRGDYFELLTKGSKYDLEPVNTLFPEL